MDPIWRNYCCKKGIRSTGSSGDPVRSTRNASTISIPIPTSTRRNCVSSTEI